MTTPSDVPNDPSYIVNRALDAIGRSDIVIGEVEEGTEGAKVALRHYLPVLKQMLRTAHWDFARAQVPLALLADGTGQTPGVGTVVPSPWTYEYALPVDCMKVRFLPWNTVPVQPNPPIMTGIGQPALNSVRLIPAPFLVAMDANYPVMTQPAPSWPQMPQWWGVAGTGPVQRTVILTNVPPQPQGSNPTVFPSLVYTALIPYPSQWESLFEEAFVQALAERLALPLSIDKKFGLAVRAQCEASAKAMIAQARLTNGNESSWPQTTDHMPDWMRVRTMGGGTGWGTYGPWGGAGMGNGTGFFGGWDSFAFSSGSVF